MKLLSQIIALYVPASNLLKVTATIVSMPYISENISDHAFKKHKVEKKKEKHSI